MLPDNHEPSSWLRGALARRAAELAGLVSLTSTPVVLAPLTGPPIGSGTAADRTCDRCSVFVPSHRKFLTMAAWCDPRIILVIGLCKSCGEREGIGGGEGQ